MSTSTPADGILQLTADIVAAHVAHNDVDAGDLPKVIRSVYASLRTAAAPPAVGVRAEPAVPIKKSVVAGYIVCLEDGKKLKMLRRHLQASYGMTPDQYRAKWQLPSSYPMVAPDYAARRSAIAMESGLGRKPAPVSEPEPVPVTTTEVVVTQIPARKRGRRLGSKNRQAALEAVAVE